MLESNIHKDEEEYGFYGEDADETKRKEIKGITDKVSDFTLTGMSYPCIVFNPDFKCPKHKLKVVSNMVKSKSEDKDIAIYFINKGDLYKIGSIDGLQVNAFLEIIGEENLTGFYEDGKKLVGDKLFTLSRSAFL